MVVTFAPSICHTKTVHALTALPSTCTTQAPHWDVSQPTCVPVSRRFSRKNCTNSVRGSTSPVTALPFTVRATAVMASSSKMQSNVSFFAPRVDSVDGSCQIGPILRNRTGASQPSIPRSTTGGHRGRKLLEEIVSGLLCRAVDETLSELCQLAANLCLHVISEKGAAVLVGERDLGTALCKSRHTSLAFAGDAVAVRWIEIRKPYLSLPARLDRTDLDRGNGLELVIRYLVELLASWNAGPEHFRVVELCPDNLPRRRKLDLPVHGHRHRASSTLDIEI